MRPATPTRGAPSFAQLESGGSRRVAFTRLVPLLGLLAAAGCEAGSDDLFTHYLQRWGVVGGCLGAYLGGLFVSLTPCVYPMIALTVSLFGANPSQKRSRAVVLSAVYVAGLAAMYVPLGVAAGLTGELFASVLGSPWVLGSIVLLLLALASSMLGYWELALPPSLQTRLSGVGGVGTLGAFLMGLVAGLLAAPCAGPVTIALLAWVGSAGNPVLGGLYFFFYAIGIGTLFFLVGAFAMSLPRAGRWTELIKGAGGLVIVVLSGYYLSVLFPSVRALPWRSAVLLAGSCGALAAGLALGALHLGISGASPGPKVRKAVAVLLFLVGGTGLLLAATAHEDAIEWRHDYEVAEAEAREAGRPMLVDFTAAWCGACGELDRHTFGDPRVAEAVERFAPIRVDATRQDERAEAFMARHDVRGLPTVLVLGADGRERSRVTEFVPPERLLEILANVR